MRKARLIAWSVLIEAVRRREIYVIVAVSVILLGAVLGMDFFRMEGLTKFYLEICLKIMSMATALTVITLSCRQLPREFKDRTIYPLLAKPVGRGTFLAGKLAGVLMAAVFCFALFMAVFVAGSLATGLGVPWTHFAQFLYLQMLMMGVLASLGFLLSLVMNMDAAITMSVIFYLTANIFTTGLSYIYEFVGRVERAFLVVMNYALPQLTLFDFSEKTVHAETWGPLGAGTLAVLTVYALFFIAVYFGLSLILFRRRAL
ncbi:MAG TPA: ABC transporter permease [Candidatus Sumerlaeota bacterium]|nr:ABC transporter permease [Candidatus Sumerlaeota bacterium]